MSTEITVVPEVLLDDDGYPTSEWLAFISNYSPDVMPVVEFVDKLLRRGWQFADKGGFKLTSKYRGIRKLELHTFGWSGNEDVLTAILQNSRLTVLWMKFVKWEAGGHYYFEIKC